MRESDIRPADLLAEYLRLSAADARRFFPDPEAFVARACPGCGAEQPVSAFVKTGFTFVRCGACDTLYAATVPSDQDLGAFYADSPSQRYWAEVFFPAVAEARREKIFRPRVERLRALTREHGEAPSRIIGEAPSRIIDVGAGTGIFLEECRALGFGRELRAVEPNGAMARRLKEGGFTTCAGFATDAALAWGGWADLTVSFEVLEHTTSPLAFVTGLKALTRPGGLILVSGLCGTGFDIMVLGERSNAVSPPHHLTFLSRAGVAALLRRAGLEEVAFLTPGQLDVDIVRSAALADPAAVADPFLRRLVTGGDAERSAFQALLAAHGLSSHMWLVARVSS
ncbi:MAG: class I SAM-dependent methyltransferase [Alphaproteobacteria bacterium]